MPVQAAGGVGHHGGFDTQAGQHGGGQQQLVEGQTLVGMQPALHDHDRHAGGRSANQPARVLGHRGGGVAGDFPVFDGLASSTASTKLPRPLPRTRPTLPVKPSSVSQLHGFGHPGLPRFGQKHQAFVHDSCPPMVQAELVAQARSRSPGPRASSAPFSFSGRNALLNPLMSRFSVSSRVRSKVSTASRSSWTGEVWAKRVLSVFRVTRRPSFR